MGHRRRYDQAPRPHDASRVFLATHPRCHDFRDSDQQVTQPPRPPPGRVPGHRHPARDGRPVAGCPQPGPPPGRADTLKAGHNLSIFSSARPRFSAETGPVLPTPGSGGSSRSSQPPAASRPSPDARRSRHRSRSTDARGRTSAVPAQRAGCAAAGTGRQSEGSASRPLHAPQQGRPSRPPRLHDRYEPPPRDPHDARGTRPALHTGPLPAARMPRTKPPTRAMATRSRAGTMRMRDAPSSTGAMSAGRSRTRPDSAARRWRHHRGGGAGPWPGRVRSVTLDSNPSEPPSSFSRKACVRSASARSWGSPSRRTIPAFCALASAPGWSPCSRTSTRWSRDRCHPPKARPPPTTTTSGGLFTAAVRQKQDLDVSRLACNGPIATTSVEVREPPPASSCSLPR